MGSIHINPDGHVNVNGQTRVQTGDTAAQNAYTGGGNVTYYRPGGDNAIRWDGGEYVGSYTGGGTQPTPVGTINGQTFYDAGEYSAAKERADFQRRQQERDNAAKAKRDTKQGIIAQAPSTMQSIAGLDKLTTEQVAEQAKQQQQQQQEEAGPKVTTNKGTTVSGSGEVETAKPTTKPSADSQISNDVPEVPVEDVTREVEATPSEEPGKPGRPKKQTVAKSRIAEAMRRWDEEAGDGSRTTYLSPSDVQDMIDSADPDGVIHDNEVLLDALKNWREDSSAEIFNNAMQENWYAKKQRYRDIVEQNEQAQRDYFSKRNEIKDKIIDSIRRSNADFAAGPLSGLDDTEWNGFTDLGKAKTEEERLEKLKKNQESRSEKFYNDIKEETPDSGGFDNKTSGQRPWMDNERRIQKKFTDIRNEIIRRLVNPALMSIQSEHVQTKTEGKGRNAKILGRIRYSKEVEDAIHNVAEIYDCSIRDVLALVQLRAGLGIDIKGRIAGKKPKKFKLSDAQVVELCRDIVQSQTRYGHPMAIVNGTPGRNGVRDDSGKFVVVAGTRCFPLGYVPTYLLANLSAGRRSVLHNTSIGETERKIGNAWINDTYPALLENATGNLMWQARAIENMMRAVTAMDGTDPARLDIPEMTINKSMMQMANEKKNADPAIARGLEERERREKNANAKWKRKQQKRNGGRNENGDIVSPAAFVNAFRGVDSALHGVSNLAKAAKTADLFLLVTSPLEAAQSMMEQDFGNFILQTGFNMLHPGVQERYQTSDRLAQAATSKSGVEARNVAEVLYRIGGWTAIDAFLSETNADGRAKYRMTKTDVQKFLRDFGVVGDSIPTKLMERLGVDPKFTKGFQENVSGVLNLLEDTMLCSGLFQEKEAGQFVNMSMMEMAQSSVHGREAYTTAEVEEWAAESPEEMIRSLLRTDAGREAFMTQGITSLGRKSPMDYAMRRIMSANGLTELLVRTCFDRFPEYGMNKVMRQVPLSNTLSYLGSYGIDSLGSFFGVINENNNVGRYQVGGTYGHSFNSFVEGFVKNLAYDTAMASNRLLISCIYAGILQMLGGVHRPGNGDDDDEDLFNWSEWIIGNDEYAMPMKWAWFMDDFSGVGFPLGVAWAIAASESDSWNPQDWTPEAKDIATKTFMNAVANFNDGTALFDALDLFHNWDDEQRDAENPDGVGMWLHPSETEKRQTNYELSFWKFVGDMTPTVAKQLLPWSRDFIFRGGDPYDRTASKVYANSNQENGETKYSMEDAISQYRVTDVKSYNDYMLRREAKNNPIMALFLDFQKKAGFWSDEDNQKTGYMYTEMPYKTEVDDLAKVQWDRYKINQDNLSRDPTERQEACRAHAEWICQDIDANYKNPADALEKGFILDPFTRRACQEYCNWMMYSECDRQKDIELNRLREEMGMQYLPDDVYDNLVQTYDDMKAHYRMLYNNYFSSDSEIPWRLPRYKVLDSDTETRYVDSNGRAAVNPYMAYAVNRASDGLSWLDNILPIDLPDINYVTPGEAQVYRYGNRPNALPAFSPEGTLGFKDQTEPYWVRRDKEGNVTTDTNGVYNMLGDIGRPPNMTDEEFAKLQEDALAARDQLFGDRGENAIPTTGQRGQDRLDASMPSDFVTYYDPEQASSELGFSAFDKDKAASAEDLKKLQDEINDLKDMLDGGGRWTYGSGGRYYSGGGGGRYYGGGGGYSSSYNPKIYSNSRNVYSQRAAGMRSSQPYRATTSYLRPSHYASGSRKAYKRQF